MLPPRLLQSDPKPSVIALMRGRIAANAKLPQAAPADMPPALAIYWHHGYIDECYHPTVEQALAKYPKVIQKKPYWPASR